jgi:glycosyltransferase involved in cell wall biosynthesis
VDRALRVAAHNGAPVWGGAEIAVTRLLLGLQERGHAVRIYCNDPEVKRRAADAGLLARRAKLGGDIAVHHAVRFGRELRRRRPDALILGTFRKLWLGSLAARRAGVPRVVARIGLETDMPRNAKYRYVFEHWIDAVVFNADVMRQRFLETLPGFPGETVTIHTGVRAPTTRGGTTFRATLGIPLDAPLIGSVGRLAEQKRYDRLAAVLAAMPDAHAVVVGEGAERDRIERAAREAGVAARLHLPGHRDDVGPALDAMDVFVLTSDREGLSNAMLEAMAAGVPVVSTDVSGAREALEPLDDGSVPGVVVGFDPAGIAGAVGPLIDDRARLRDTGESARRAARERFSVARMLDRWETVLAPDPNGA